MNTNNSVVDKTEQIPIGERIRNLRTSLNMSVRSLASKTGFSPSFISQVENGQVSPSISSLERIASTLGLTLAGFFIGGGSDNPVVTRADNRQEITSSWSRARIEALMSSGVTRHLEAVMITVAPGGRSGKQPSNHPGEEFALVYDGKISLTLGTVVHTLQRGDTVSFKSEVPHLWENPALENAQVVIVSPRFTH